MTAKAIREQALALPPAERLTLMQDLWDSLEMDDASLPLSDEHARIIDERLAAHEADPNAVVSWEEAKAAARQAVADAKKAR
jgi:putative addiction module component (TIGR02574 family)